MRIKLRSGKTRLSFWFPLSAVKSKFVYKMIVGNVKRKKREQMCLDSGEQREEQNQVDVTLQESVDAVSEQEKACDNDENTFSIDRELMKKIYSALKSVVKTHGHFTLVDVCSDNGDTTVKITI